MTIAQIECFIEIVRMGNITKAAETLFITQQAASKHIQSIEKELGFRVLKRNRKGIELTEEGTILYNDWEKLYEIYRISVDKARDFHTGKEKKVYIGLADMGKCSEDILLAFNEYEKTYTDLTVVSQIMGPREMYYMLESGKLDLAICYESEYKDISSLNCLPLHDRDLDVCVFMSKDHPLAQTDFTMEDLQSEPIGVLSIKNSIDFKVRMKDFFGYYGLQPNLTYQEYDSRRNLEMGLIAGNCVSIVYEPMFIDEESRLISKKIDVGNLSSRMAIYWKGTDNTTKARAMSQILRNKLIQFN